MEKKIAGSIRLSQEAWRLLRERAAKDSISMAAVLEIIIRKHAKEEREK